MSDDVTPADDRPEAEDAPPRRATVARSDPPAEEAASEPTVEEPVDASADPQGDEESPSHDTPSDDGAPQPSAVQRLSTRVYSYLDPNRRKAGITQAKVAISRGRLIVMPTDTVYGLAADAFDPTAVRRLLRAKGRSRTMPTPVLIGNLETMKALATGLDDDTGDLAGEFWPGALTIICRQQPSLRWDLGDSRGTVALRMPDHPDAIDVLNDNGPLAVSSANRTGLPPATTVEEAAEMLGDAVTIYLDAGPTPGPVPSTIVDATGHTLKVVREGVISLEQLRDVVSSVEGPEPTT